MGRGSVTTYGQCEGLYYVDNDFLDVYSKKNEDGKIEYCSLREADDGFEYCESESCFDRENFKFNFTEMMRARFPSFEYVNKWISSMRSVLLENELFYIAFEDNWWSLAIELIQKEGEFGDEEKVGLQMGLYPKYLKGIEEILLNMHVGVLRED